MLLSGWSQVDTGQHFTTYIAATFLLIVLRFSCLNAADVKFKPPPTQSLPGCGIQGKSYGNDIIKPFLVGGEESTQGQFPWHAALYRKEDGSKYTLDCGGTLIHHRLVITAAHCVWDEPTGKVRTAEEYVVALGKQDRDFETEKRDAQFMDVRKIHIMKRYQGKTALHQFDIALLKLNKSVEITDNVNVICMDWEKKLYHAQLAPGVEGKIAGWGYTSNGELADKLQTTSLPVVNVNECYDAVVLSAKKYLSIDRFCAGYKNKNISLCKGDSGGGLIFQDNSTWKYYLQGIVSVTLGPTRTKEICYAQTYTGFTQVSVYMEFIQRRFDKIKALVNPKKKSKSEKKCEEYASLVFQLIEPDNVNGSTCAMASPEHLTFRRFTSPMEFPHLAAVSYSDKKYINLKNMHWDEVGTLISERYVVIAGKALYNNEKKPARWVLLGATDLSVTRIAHHSKVYEVDKWILHPDCKRNSSENDIGLLRLKREVKFSAFIRPACLSRTTHINDNAVAVVTGWGLTEPSEKRTMQAKKVSIRIEASKRCSERLTRITRSTRPLPESMFCIVQAEPDGTCMVDRGSPIQIQNPEQYCMYSLVGFKCIGHPNCSGNKSLTVATSVAHFVQWIETIVWPGTELEIDKAEPEEPESEEEDDNIE